MLTKYNVKNPITFFFHTPIACYGNTHLLWSQWNVEIPIKKPWFRLGGV